MINHGRTLLLNVRYDATFAVAGDEIVDPSYAPFVPPEPLLGIVRLLFGPAPDRVSLNFRSRQLLQLVHATDLGDWLAALDPRITYNFSSNVFFVSGLAALAVTCSSLSELQGLLTAALDQTRLELLFAGDVDPYPSCRGIWFNSQQPLLQLAALVTALIYRLDESWRAGGAP